MWWVFDMHGWDMQNHQVWWLGQSSQPFPPFQTSNNKHGMLHLQLIKRIIIYSNTMSTSLRFWWVGASVPISPCFKLVKYWNKKCLMCILYIYRERDTKYITSPKIICEIHYLQLSGGFSGGSFQFVAAQLEIGNKSLSPHRKEWTSQFTWMERTNTSMQEGPQFAS